MSHRPEQLASEIHRAIQQVIARGFQDPRISGLITVTDVKVSNDLKDATIMVSVLPAEKQPLTLHGLQAAERHIRRECGELVRSKELPTFHIRSDASLKKQAGVIRELEKVREEREKGQAPGTWGAPIADPTQPPEAG